MGTNGKLTPEQKQEIVRRVQAGESGSALAKEFGVSASLVSKMKKDAANAQPQRVVAPTKPAVKAPTKSMDAAPATGGTATPAPEIKKFKRKFMLYSGKNTQGREHSTNAETFGELIKEIEMNNVEGIMANFTGKQKSNLRQHSDPLPKVFDNVIHLFLSPLKSDSGNA